MPSEIEMLITGRNPDAKKSVAMLEEEITDLENLMFKEKRPLALANIDKKKKMLETLVQEKMAGKSTLTEMAEEVRNRRGQDWIDQQPSLHEKAEEVRSRRGQDWVDQQPSLYEMAEEVKSRRGQGWLNQQKIKTLIGSAAQQWARDNGVTDNDSVKRLIEDIISQPYIESCLDLAEHADEETLDKITEKAMHWAIHYIKTSSSNNGKSVKLSQVMLNEIEVEEDMDSNDFWANLFVGNNKNIY